MTGDDELEVAARGDLGHDAAVARVQVRLRRDDVGQNRPVLGDEGRGRLVTRGLDAQNHDGPSGHLPVSDTRGAIPHG